MEAAAASSGDCGKRSMLNLPRGYHFAPTEQELIVHYLRPKIAGLKPLLPIFQYAKDVSRSPEEITEEYKDFGEDGRWYFFTKRRRKYLSGNRPNRTTAKNECWKATGPQREIKIVKGEEEIVVGRVRTLVFYGAPPKETDPETGLPTGKKKKAQSEEKTSWTMYEYENLTSKEEAADHSVDKLEEWVLCTIQHQKKKDGGEEGSGAGKKKVKETKGEEKVKAASRKRKGKQEEIKAENVADQAQIQDLQAMKRPKVPMLPPHPEETFAPEEGYESGMFDYNGCPLNSSPVLPMQHDESPLSEILSPSIVDNDNCYHQNMAPAPSLNEPPHSEMMSIPSGGNCNIGSAGSNGMSSMFCYFEGLLLPYIVPPALIAGITNSSCNTSIAPVPLPQERPHPHMRMGYETSPYSGYSNHNFARNMVTHQPATNLPHPHSVAAPTAAYSYGGAAQNTADHHCSYGQADPGFMEMLLNTGAISSHSLGRRFPVSSQYHGGPSALVQGRAVAAAAALPRQDQVTART